LGEALVRRLRDGGEEVVGIDVLPGDFTSHAGSIADGAFVRKVMSRVTTVFHAATLHKPHVATHRRQEFVDVNVTGTLVLLEAAAAARVESFIYTSTTSVFGDAMVPPAGEPAQWVTEELTPIPKNIYGVTKAAAEDLCQLFWRNEKLPCVVLRTSRFFPEEDDDRAVREAFSGENMKMNEFLYRRVEIEDVVSAHQLAARHAERLGFGKFIISATTPFLREDLAELRVDATRVLARRVPGYEEGYERLGWRFPASIDRVYVNRLARDVLGWRPRYDFEYLLGKLRAGESARSLLAESVGSKGYHRGRGDAPLKL
jgi:nucleoside-diphosphate-sugar epimerase